MEGQAVVQGEEGTLGVEAGDQAGGGAGEGGHLFCLVLGVGGVGWEEGREIWMGGGAAEYVVSAGFGYLEWTDVIDVRG